MSEQMCRLEPKIAGAERMRTWAWLQLGPRECPREQTNGAFKEGAISSSLGFPRNGLQGESPRRLTGSSEVHSTLDAVQRTYRSISPKPPIALGSTTAVDFRAATGTATGARVRCTYPSTILAGFGSLTRCELSNLLAVFEEDTTLLNVAGRIKNFGDRVGTGERARRRSGLSATVGGDGRRRVPVRRCRPAGRRPTSRLDRQRTRAAVLD